MFYINNEIASETRYDMSKFMDYIQGCYCILDSYLCTQIKSIPYSGVLTVTSQVGRPDLISYDIYGNTQYWWLIMLYNDITSPQEITSGKPIAFPSLSAMENLYFTLSTKQKTKDTQAE